MVVVVFVDVEIDAALTFIGISVVHDFFDELDLFDDVAGGMWFDTGRQHVERLHGVMEAVGVVLSYFHWLELFQTSFFGNFVFAFVGIVFQMANVRDVAHITYLITDMHQIAVEQIERNGRTGMSQMGITIDGRAANVHADTSRSDRFELFFLSG